MAWLSNKNIIITGASSGIGAAAAKWLAKHNAYVLLADIDSESGLAVAEQIRGEGGKAVFIEVDVSDGNSVSAMMDRAVELAGAVDVAINNAGVEHANIPLAECDEELWDRTMNINLKGVFLCMKQQILHMQKQGGHIINLASVAGLHSAPYLAPYAASKHGVVGLTRSAAVEYARYNIRCNAVCPGVIRTPMAERALQAMSEKKRVATMQGNPMRRMGEPTEIAKVIAWLASDESSFLTGETIRVDGGMLA